MDIAAETTSGSLVGGVDAVDKSLVGGQVAAVAGVHGKSLPSSLVGLKGAAGMRVATGHECKKNGCDDQLRCSEQALHNIMSKREVVRKVSYIRSEVVIQDHEKDTAATNRWMRAALTKEEGARLTNRDLANRAVA